MRLKSFFWLQSYKNCLLTYLLNKVFLEDRIAKIKYIYTG